MCVCGWVGVYKYIYIHTYIYMFMCVCVYMRASVRASEGGSVYTWIGVAKAVGVGVPTRYRLHRLHAVLLHAIGHLLQLRLEGLMVAIFVFYGVAHAAVRQKIWKSQCPSMFTMCSHSIRTFENDSSLPLPETKP